LTVDIGAFDVTINGVTLTSILGRSRLRS